ncbi:tryptophan-rich sensory protein [Demequina aestuarii]|uniref:tryptophan-rich sensory protein n=1 Tax=Demequina aestuarii TaxID=327095 RepID=UPI000A72C3FC|nr:tryptophan-rich sensory protein [Demequina aestuarii]
MTPEHHVQATRSDRLRQVTVAIGAALAIVGAAWGAGAFGGTPIAEASGGALAADATLLAPAQPAFGIWSVIYAGLAVFAVYQALPGRATDPRLRAVTWPVLASMVLNAAWIGTVQAGWLWVSVIVIIVLVAVLASIAVTLLRIPPSSWKDRLTTDVTVGLYLGWVSVATAANIAATGRNSLGAAPDDGTALAILVLVAVAAVAVAFAVLMRGRPALVVATGIAMAWGLAWIAAARGEGDPQSLTVMWAAGLAAVAAFCAPFAVFDFARDRAPRPPAPGRPVR